MICNFTLKRFFLHQFTAYDLQRHAKPWFFPLKNAIKDFQPWNVC
jgi:hypothetical protein